jgi:hypothetical protein
VAAGDEAGAGDRKAGAGAVLGESAAALADTSGGLLLGAASRGTGAAHTA